MKKMYRIIRRFTHQKTVPEIVPEIHLSGLKNGINTFIRADFCAGSLYEGGGLIRGVTQVLWKSCAYLWEGGL